MPDVKLAMQFGTTQFSAEGSEVFVNTALERWVQLAKESVVPATQPGPSKESAKQASTGSSANPNAQYENVYDEVEGKLKIIAQMPGSNKAAKTRSTALVLLYGNYLCSQHTTSADDIRDACLDQGCYDSSNFASNIRALKEKVAMNTKAGGGYDVKLTAPGRKAAQELVEKTNDEAN